jgi:DNA invertase Pin-like site-specific DNA recombinase
MLKILVLWAKPLGLSCRSVRPRQLRGNAKSRLLSPPLRFRRARHSAKTRLDFFPLARNLDDLRRLVQQLTRRGIRIEFVKEGLTFTGEDSTMAHLMLSVMGAFAEFERSLLRERQREGIALARQRGAYRGRKPSLTAAQITDLKRRIAAGEGKAHVARELGVSRETVYQYLRAPA